LERSGPAESLFQGSFYGSVLRALKPGGVVAFQGESMWLHVDLIKRSFDGIHKHFPVAGYASAYVPTYPGGQIGYVPFSCFAFFPFSLIL
jgi:spermidine synthase